MTKLELDNRDDSTTELVYGIMRWTINPKDVMLNMIQNLPSPLNERYKSRFSALVRDLEDDLNLMIDTDGATEQ